MVCKWCGDCNIQRDSMFFFILDEKNSEGKSGLVGRCSQRNLFLFYVYNCV